MADWIRVCDAGELLPGEQRVAWLNDTPVLVINIDGELYAIEDRCSHEDFELSVGELRGYELECALHGARFDVRTGAVLCPPAYLPVQAFPVKCEADAVWLRDPREE